MANRQGTLVPVERLSRDVSDSKPARAYFMADSTQSGRYVLGTGAKGSEATAYLMADATQSGRFVLSNTAADEARIPYHVGTTVII